MNPDKHDDTRAIGRWLMVVYAVIFLLVIVGGLTRLTGSGLSMVDWHPVYGVLPPISDAEWLAVFDQYKLTPQYKTINSAMTLEGFKAIFYWEYGHRMLGRLVGIVFFLPFIYFAFIRKTLTGGMLLRTLLIGILGGMQGLLGWYMVKSGLVDQPYVSHFRLAAHLMLALFIMMFIYWTFLALRLRPVLTKPRLLLSYYRLPKFTLGLLVIVVILQIMYGAFTAGLHAGVGYNTFPTMNGEWLPAKLWDLSPALANFFYNTVTIQFMHRVLGILTAVLTVWYAFKILVTNRSHILLKRGTSLLVLLVFGQVALGIVTLLKVVPVPLASLHQIGAVLVLTCLTYVVFISKTLEYNLNRRRS